jgi:hypothetical protein
MTRITENDLILPALYIIYYQPTAKHHNIRTEHRTKAYI